VLGGVQKFGWAGGTVGLLSPSDCWEDAKLFDRLFKRGLKKLTWPLITISVQLQHLSYGTKTVGFTHAHSLQFFLGVGHIRCRMRSIVPTFQYHQNRSGVASNSPGDIDKSANWWPHVLPSLTDTQQKVTYINTVWAGVMVDPNLDGVLTDLQLGFGSQCKS